MNIILLAYWPVVPTGSLRGGVDPVWESILCGNQSCCGVNSGGSPSHTWIYNPVLGVPTGESQSCGVSQSSGWGGRGAAPTCDGWVGMVKQLNDVILYMGIRTFFLFCPNEPICWHICPQKSSWIAWRGWSAKRRPKLIRGGFQLKSDHKWRA